MSWLFVLDPLVLTDLLLYGAQPMDPAEFKNRIDQIYSQLDAYTYYELLKVQPLAEPEQIRTSFHRLALSMHPDQYLSHPDKELREKLYVIYKRITEAYQVLLDTRSRKEYDLALKQGQRRLVQRQKKTTSQPRPEQAIQDPQAKKFFLMGQDAERRKDYKNARINYKFAMDLAGELPVILERIAAVDAAITAAKK